MTNEMVMIKDIKYIPENQKTIVVSNFRTLEDIETKELNIHLNIDNYLKRLEGTVKIPTIRELKLMLCDLYGYPSELLFSKCRKRELVLIRQIAMAYLYTNKLHNKGKVLSLEFIGDEIAGRDHATVLHAIRTIKGYTETKDEMHKGYSDILKNHLKKKGYSYEMIKLDN